MQSGFWAACWRLRSSSNNDGPHSASEPSMGLDRFLPEKAAFAEVASVREMQGHHERSHVLNISGEVAAFCHQYLVTAAPFSALSLRRTPCEAQGMSVIAGECPLMYLPQTGWVHRLHGWLHGV